MLNYLKNLFSKKDEDKLVNILKYPDKIIVETYYKTDTGIFVRSSDISILSNNISALEIGQVVLNHLNLCKSGISYKNFDHKKSAENYKKLTGLKTIKAQMLNSKNISISLNINTYKFLPYKNGGTTGNNRGYTPISEFEKIQDNLDTEKLGEIINEMWQFCD